MAHSKFTINVGHTTNSSSSHTIVVVNNINNVKPINYSYSKYSFLDPSYVLVSKEDKKMFLSCLLWENLQRLFLYNFNGLSEKEQLKFSYDNFKEFLPESYIDSKILNIVPSLKSESLLLFPINQKDRRINKHYFEVFKKYLLRDDIVVIGGRDSSCSELMEDGYSEYKYDFTEIFPYKIFYSCSELWISEEENYIAIYTPKNNYGSFVEKYRFVKEGCNENSIDVRNLTKIETLDIKITNYCSKNCKYCYQDSKKETDLCPDEDILRKIVEEIRPFSIALGGGDPLNILSHTNIKKIFPKKELLEISTSIGMFPENKNFNLIDNLNKLDAFALSINSPEEIPLIKKLEKIICNPKKYVHHILGSVSLKDFEDMVKSCVECNIPIVLLRHKNIGRSKENSFTVHEDTINNWQEVINKNTVDEIFNQCLIDVSCDSCLSCDKEAMNKIKCKLPNTCMDCDAGYSSMYIDLTKSLAAPCSFWSKESMIKIVDSDFNLDFTFIEKVRNLRKEVGCPLNFFKEGKND